MRFHLLLSVVFAVALCGCAGSVPNGPVLVVATKYPGAPAQVVADNVAVPIEQQINGVERLLRMESESRDDGAYVALLTFEPNTDPDKAKVLVLNRIALAVPMLSNEVEGISVKIQSGAVEREKKPVSLALVDRSNNSRESLLSLAKNVIERLSADGAMEKAEVFPGPDVDHIYGKTDPDKQMKYGVSHKDLNETLRKIVPSNKDLEAVKMWPVRSDNGEDIPLGSLGEFKLVNEPSGVFRVDMHPAIRVSGAPPEGKSAESAAKRCEELAKEEIEKQRQYAEIQVLNLTSDGQTQR
jgi:multidrug efflux pump subunit AcrB